MFLRIFKEVKNYKGKFLDNLGQNICRHFQVLAQFPLTTCEAELDYYHENVKYQMHHELPNDLI